MKEMGGLILRNDGGMAYNRAYLASCLRHSAQILASLGLLIPARR